MNVGKTQPMELISRYLMIHTLRQQPIMQLKQIVEEQKLPGYYFVFIDEEQEGEVVTLIELNYEWLFFEATTYQIEQLVKNFIKPIKPEKPKSKIIMP